MEPETPKVIVPLRMKSNFMEPAQLRIPNPELLINLVSRRVRQLAQGHRPITQTDPRMEFVDIALKEISEGKLGYEFANEPEFVPEASPVIVESPLVSVP